MKGKDYYLKNHCAHLLSLSGQDLTKLLDKKKLTFDEIIASLGDRFQDSFLLLLPKLDNMAFAGNYLTARSSSALQAKLPELIVAEAGRVDGAPNLKALRSMLTLLDSPLKDLETHVAHTILMALSSETCRGLFFENACALIDTASDEQLFSIPPDQTNSLFASFSKTEALRAFWEMRLQKISEIDFGIICARNVTNINLNEFLLSHENWFDFAIKTLPKVSVYGLIQTEGGRQILLADGARLLRAMPIKEMTPRFIRSLFQYLDESESLQRYLEEETCPLIEKLIEPYYDTFVLNVSGPYDTASDAVDSEDRPLSLSSPLLQLSKSPFGRTVLSSHEGRLLNHISAKALTMGNKEDETPLFYLLDEPDIVTHLLQDDFHFGEWGTLSVSAKIKVADATEISLIDKIIAHPKGLQILFANELSGLQALSKEEKACLQRQASLEAYQKSLASLITSAESFVLVSDFLIEDKCLTWFRTPMFQKALKGLIARDLSGLVVLPEKYRHLFFSMLTPEVLEPALIDVMKNKGSYQAVLDFLLSMNRSDWIKHEPFQHAIALLFIQLLNSNSLPTEEEHFRLFTQMMGRTALNFTTSEGDSVLSCLCRFEDGVKLIQQEKLFELVDTVTLDKSIRVGTALSTSLRTLLRDACKIVLRLDTDAASPLFFPPA